MRHPHRFAALAVSLASALGTGCGASDPEDKEQSPLPVLTQCEDDVFCIVATRGTGKIDLSLRSYDATTATITLTVEASNLTPSVQLPLTVWAKGAGETALLTLTQTDTTAAYSYRYHYDWGIGTPDAAHDDTTVYRLPFATGAAFFVAQGYNGSFSHTGEEQYALDFAMEEGTPVFAARGGRVVEVENGFDAGGTDPSFKTKGNRLSIEHDDGTIGGYVHFKKDGVTVEPGDVVEAGDPVGLSGNTGHSTGPHLHFEVYRRVDGATRATLPVQFKTADGITGPLKEGSRYEAVDL